MFPGAPMQKSIYILRGKIVGSWVRYTFNATR